jgi:uncharacterized protein (TIGR03435 family)
MAGIGCLVVNALLAYAQTPQFEVASVKPAAADARGSRCNGGPGTTDPVTLTCENYSLSLLTMMAYNLRGFQLSAPDWMNSVRFDVTAKIPPDTEREEFELMLQGLLAERFGLKAHFEKKAMPVYELWVAKGGAKLKQSEEAPPPRIEAAWRPPAGGPPRRTMAKITRKNELVTDLADFISNQLGLPVIDATGLSGRYDYTLSFVMEPGGRAAGPDATTGTEPELGTSLIEALRDELGLRLERTKGQAEVLVVDHAEKVPTGN